MAFAIALAIGVKHKLIPDNYVIATLSESQIAIIRTPL
jgi:hypothetical protein